MILSILLSIFSLRYSKRVLISIALAFVWIKKVDFLYCIKNYLSFKKSWRHYHKPKKVSSEISMNVQCPRFVLQLMKISNIFISLSFSSEVGCNVLPNQISGQNTLRLMKSYTLQYLLYSYDQPLFDLVLF